MRARGDARPTAALAAVRAENSRPVAITLGCGVTRAEGCPISDRPPGAIFCEGLRSPSQTLRSGRIQDNRLVRYTRVRRLRRTLGSERERPVTLKALHPHVATPLTAGRRTNLDNQNKTAKKSTDSVNICYYLNVVTVAASSVFIRPWRPWQFPSVRSTGHHQPKSGHNYAQSGHNSARSGRIPRASHSQNTRENQPRPPPNPRFCPRCAQRKRTRCPHRRTKRKRRRTSLPRDAPRSSASPRTPPRPAGMEPSTNSSS
jgi:hypothetical protein